MARWLLIYWIHASILEWRVGRRRGQKDLALLGSYNFGSMVLREPRGALSTRLASRENVRASRTRPFSRVAVGVLLRITFPCVRLWVCTYMRKLCDEISLCGFCRYFGSSVSSLFPPFDLLKGRWRVCMWCDQDGQCTEYIYLYFLLLFSTLYIEEY